MSEPSTQTVIDRLDTLSLAIIDGIGVPERSNVVMTPEPRSPRRKWLFAAAAAIVLALAGGSLLVFGTDNSEVHTVDAPQADERVPEWHLIPTVWPAGSVETTDGYPTRGMQSLVDATLFARDGRTVAKGSVTDVPSQPATTSEVDAGIAQNFELDGHPATWSQRRDEDDQFVVVSLEPGRTLVVSSRVVDRASLVALAKSYDEATERFDLDLLPDGWTMPDDPAGMALGGGMSWPSSWEVASRTVSAGSVDDVNQTVAVASHPLEDAVAVVEQIAELDGDRAVWVAMGGGRRGVLRTTYVETVPTYSLHWAITDTAIAVASGMSITSEELIATARSVRSVSDAEWSALHAPTTSPYAEVDGFRVDQRGTIIDSGTTDGHRWIVTQIPNAELRAEMEGIDPSIRDGLTTELHVLDGMGEQVSTSVRPEGVGQLGGGFVRLGASVVVNVQVPFGLTDVRMTIEDAPVEPLVIQIPTVQQAMVLAILPARSTGQIDSSTAVVAGTLPDGTTWDNTPLWLKDVAAVVDAAEPPG